MSWVGWLIFLFFALLTILSASVVAFSRNIVHSAFALLATFVGVAGLFVFLGADFLAAIQVIVYIGGILVLILFAIMLTREILNVKLSNRVAPAFTALFIIIIFSASIIGFLYLSGILDIPIGKRGIKYEPITRKIGLALLNKYLFPFEVGSIVLLVALVGAVYMARVEKRTNGGTEKQEEEISNTPPTTSV